MAPLATPLGGAGRDDEGRRLRCCERLPGARPPTRFGAPGRWSRYRRSRRSDHSARDDQLCLKIGTRARALKHRFRTRPRRHASLASLWLPCRGVARSMQLSAGGHRGSVEAHSRTVEGPGRKAPSTGLCAALTSWSRHLHSPRATIEAGADHPVPSPERAPPRRDARDDVKIDPGKHAVMTDRRTGTRPATRATALRRRGCGIGPVSGWRCQCRARGDRTSQPARPACDRCVAWVLRGGRAHRRRWSAVACPRNGALRREHVTPLTPSDPVERIGASARVRNDPSKPTALIAD